LKIHSQLQLGVHFLEGSNTRGFEKGVFLKEQIFPIPRLSRRNMLFPLLFRLALGIVSNPSSTIFLRRHKKTIISARSEMGSARLLLLGLLQLQIALFCADQD